MPFGPPTLWPLIATRSAAAARGARGRARRSGLHGVGVEHGVRGDASAHTAATASRSLDRADLVVGEHDRHDRDRGPAPSSAAEVRRGRARPTASTATVAAAARSDRRRAPAWCSIGRAQRPGRRPAREHAADGQVVGLGAAGGEHDLAGLERRAARRCRRGRRRAAGGPSRAQRCEPDGLPGRRPSTATMAATASGRIGVVGRVVEVGRTRPQGYGRPPAGRRSDAVPGVSRRGCTGDVGGRVGAERASAPSPASGRRGPGRPRPPWRRAGRASTSGCATGAA